MNNYDSPQPEMPMKWHKFLIYFSLWFGALICVVSGFQLLTGSQYGSSDAAARVYARFNSLKGVDSVFGVIYILLAAFMIYTRFQLAGFRDGAPNKLTLVYVAQVVVYLIYAFAVSSMVGMSIAQALSSQAVGSIVASIVMIFVNRVYYNKRIHLFNR